MSRKKFKGKVEATIYRALQMDKNHIKNLEAEVSKRMAEKIANGLWNQILWRERLMAFGLITGFVIFELFLRG